MDICAINELSEVYKSDLTGLGISPVWAFRPLFSLRKSDILHVFYPSRNNHQELQFYITVYL